MLVAWRIFARSIRDLNPGGGMTALADFESAPFDLLGNAPNLQFSQANFPAFQRSKNTFDRILIEIVCPIHTERTENRRTSEETSGNLPTAYNISSATSYDHLSTTPDWSLLPCGLRAARPIIANAVCGVKCFLRARRAKTQKR